MPAGVLLPRDPVDNPARRKCAPFKAKALAENWSCRKLAAESGIHRNTAHRIIQDWHMELRTKIGIMSNPDSPDLASVARNIRDADLRMMDKLQGLIDRLQAQISAGDDINAKELDLLASLLGKRWKHLESLTGMDVAKQIAVRREALKDSQPVTWDGVDAITVTPIALNLPQKVEPEGVTDKEILGDLW